MNPLLMHCGRAHAPRGGIEIDGQEYAGGQFLPEADSQPKGRRREATAVEGFDKIVLPWAVKPPPAR